MTHFLSVSFLLMIKKLTIIKKKDTYHNKNTAFVFESQNTDL
jgi:hypothetical protein